MVWIEAEASNHCKLLMMLHDSVLNKYINGDYFFKHGSSL